MTFLPPRGWTPAEDTVLRERVSIASFNAIARDLGRSGDSVKNRAVTLGLYSTGFGEDAAAERAIRAATQQLARRIREVALHRGVGLPIMTARGGA